MAKKVKFQKEELVIKSINEIIWGNGMLVLILGIGIFFTIKLKWMQFNIPFISKTIINSLFTKTKPSEKKGISQFQAMTTVLAATMGTGNIVGVATALTLGGPGSIFWMWVSAIFGMMTVFSENVLGLYYRYKSPKGEWMGGPMVTMEKGLNSKWLGMIYAALCILASFGMGNMAQINSISSSLQSAFGINTLLSGIFVSIILALIIIGGLSKIGKFTEKVIPIISCVYILGAILIIVLNYQGIQTAFSQIFTNAFAIKPVVGGIAGVTIRQAINIGFRRGVFSNEAGLGTSALVHSSINSANPVVQGVWGIFEVFFDTIICCTLTALAILTSGVLGKVGSDGSILDGAPLVISAFSTVFGETSGSIISICVVIFAFATLVGWSFYGSKATEYLFGCKAVPIYKVIFIGIVIIGATSELSIVWEISDTLNGLMAIPNLISLILLSPIVIKLTKEYTNRNKLK